MGCARVFGCWVEGEWGGAICCNPLCSWHERCSVLLVRFASKGPQRWMLHALMAVAHWSRLHTLTACCCPPLPQSAGQDLVPSVGGHTCCPPNRHTNFVGTKRADISPFPAPRQRLQRGAPRIRQWSKFAQAKIWRCNPSDPQREPAAAAISSTDPHKSTAPDACPAYGKC